MSVHSVPVMGPSANGAGEMPASAALFRRPRELRRRVLIRRSRVWATDAPAISDRDTTPTVVPRRESRLRPAA